MKINSILTIVFQGLKLRKSLQIILKITSIIYKFFSIFSRAFRAEQVIAEIDSLVMELTELESSILESNFDRASLE